MEQSVQLNKAFHDFTQASRSLETYYEKLHERVMYLTQELEKKNGQLKKAVSEVSESKDYLDTVLQSIGDAMIVVDQSDRVSMMNRAAEELLRTSCDEASSRKFENLDMSLSEGRSGTVLTVQGMKYFVMTSRSVVYGQDGSVRGYVILIKDITKVKDMEKQHERNQRLISMGEMAATIVHEIRSPLCSIELYSNMLSADLAGTRHSDMASGISTGIKSLNNILTNMLYFAKPQKASFTAMKLSDVVGESVAMLRPLIDNREIVLSLDLLDKQVKGDRELIKQVFMNIIINAVHAVNESGILHISMSEVNEYVNVAVADNGCGISPENLEKIFDPFFSTSDRGTGLGLAIASKIMQSHNGFIEAVKNEGAGSTFTLSFPAITGKHEHNPLEKQVQSNECKTEDYSCC